jgi:predicted nucleic acid-binding protein
VLDLCEQAGAIGLAVICLLEIISTLCRLVREGKLTSPHYDLLKRNLLADIADVDICMLTPSVLRHTIKTLERFLLRAMDAIHVGCAMDYQPDLFISADRRQIAAAGQGDSASSRCNLAGVASMERSATQESPASAGDISGHSDPGSRFAASGPLRQFGHL